MSLFEKEETIHYIDKNINYYDENQYNENLPIENDPDDYGVYNDDDILL